MSSSLKEIGLTNTRQLKKVIKQISALIVNGLESLNDVHDMQNALVMLYFYYHMLQVLEIQEFPILNKKQLGYELNLAVIDEIFTKRMESYGFEFPINMTDEQKNAIKFCTVVVPYTLYRLPSISKDSVKSEVKFSRKFTAHKTKFYSSLDSVDMLFDERNSHTMSMYRTQSSFFLSDKGNSMFTEEKINQVLLMPS
ncbi:MAG: hypothetical protein P1U74_07785 [Legionellaceae bacterium]|nr:hypothetical protein [Legionellaceae bacterium]